VTKRSDPRDPNPSRTAYPGGRHVTRMTAQKGKLDVDAHHLAREHGPEAIATLAANIARGKLAAP
jgi:hypothetical protein